MLGPIATLLVAGPLFWVVSWAWGWYRNYVIAKRTGLPVLMCPFSIDKIPYLLVKVPMRNVLEKWIPWEGIRPSIFGWEFIDKNQVHSRYPTFILCNPDVNEVWCAEPELANTVLARRRDYTQLKMTKVMMGKFGSNMIVTDGEDWSRQRRLIGPQLNEQISEVVWNESRVQAAQMADYMLAQPEGKSKENINALRAIAMNVLGQVGYGIPKAFEPHRLPQDPEEVVTYVDALSMIASFLILAVMIPSWILRLSFMPKVIQTLGSAVDKLPELTKNLLEDGRKYNAKKEAGTLEKSSGRANRNNFMSLLVSLADASKAADAGAPGSQYLSEEEIGGNLLLFTAAGFDTTATTLGFAVTLLSVYSQWQKWMQDEIDHVIGDQENPDYNTYFPKLSRCMAIMLETMRLYTPLSHAGRHIVDDQTVVASGKEVVMPAKSVVYINMTAMALNESFWGKDALEFRPSRWIVPETAGRLGEEQLITPPKGAFIPWSSGPRVCPGQKMAQVEFVTVVATLFSKCSVEPATKEGETMEAAKKRTLDLTSDVSPRLTLSMNHPEEIHLKWQKR